MDGIGADVLQILRYLLPGLLAAWIFYGLTAFPKPSQFERVVQALIFTLIVQVISYPTIALLLWFGTHWPIAAWTETTELITQSACACVVGFAFTSLANSDVGHAIARKNGLTNELSYPSEWFGAFKKNVRFVVLHLNDERRVYGWPRVWASQPHSGHFLIEDPAWLTEEGEQPITGVSCILINAADVKWVEFMKE